MNHIFQVEEQGQEDMIEYGDSEDINVDLVSVANSKAKSVRSNQIKKNKKSQIMTQQKMKDQFQKIRLSSDYRQIQSQNLQSSGSKKIFVYHYAQNQQFKIGQGSFGKVYCCYYQNPQTLKLYKLALKIITIPKTITQTWKIDKMVADTRQEISSLLHLKNNSNIIKIQDVIRDFSQNRIQIVLQYCNNRDLDSYFAKLHAQGKITTEKEVLRYFNQIIHAFEDVYNLNIIHKDIKPGNILVHDDVLKVSDFGTSRQLRYKLQQFDSQHQGTTLTASPQIRFKQKYTNKCDIYSLGITLYWMLFQQYPFKGIMNKSQYMDYVLTFEGKTVINPSAQLVQLLRSMLQYRQDDRIGWQELFVHPLLKQSNKIGEVFRTTIGRGLNYNYSRQFVDQKIPKQFYKYLQDDASTIDINTLPSRKFGQHPVMNCFRPILFAILNHKLKIQFLKEVLRQVADFTLSQRIKNKIHFVMIRDLIRWGLDRYIVYLMNLLKKQLTGKQPRLQLLHAKDVREVLEKHQSQFDNLCSNYVKYVQQFEKSGERPKLSQQDKKSLQKKCQEHNIQENFQRILGKQPFHREFFIQQLQKCFVQVVCFLKEEVKYYSNKKGSLGESQQRRYRQLILLIHHLNMVALLDDIFPKHFSDRIEYDLLKFFRTEKYLNRKAFYALAEDINQIVDRFQS